jgi:transcriptional regulator with XRE-family HTH domain
MDILSVFSERLSEVMFEADLSSKELAERIGISQRSVNRWKSGTALINYENLIKIVDALNCSIDFLTGRSAEKLDFTINPIGPFYKQLRQVNYGSIRNHRAYIKA